VLAAWAGLALATASGAGTDRAAQVAPYLQALSSGAVGQVEGDAYAEPRRPSGAPVPFADVSVLLLPYAPDVEARLDALKAHLRDSVSSYTDTHGQLVDARVAYEHELLAAGGGELIRGAVSGPDGKVHLTGVPEGEWLLIGWREVPHPLKAKGPGRDAAKFAERPVSAGYGAISFWRFRVSVRAGESTPVALSERSVWLTAVREQFVHRGEVIGPSPARPRR
jgi:hypothetical protein